MIIDIRCRYLTTEEAKYFSHARQVQSHDTPESFFAWLDKQGIDTVLSPAAASLGLTLGRWDLPARSINNDKQAELQRQYPERFVGVAAIDPGNVVHNGLQELERCVKTLGLRIASIEPGRKPMLVANPANTRLYDFYQRASDLDVPVIIQTSGLKGGENIDYANPRWIDQIAADFPKLHIICAHGCAPWHKELALVTRRRPNVYASPDLYTFLDLQWCKWTEAGQLIFASGFPYVSVESIKRAYLTAHWGDAHKVDDLMYRNAIRALKLDRIPYFAAKLNSPDVFKTVSPGRQG